MVMGDGDGDGDRYGVASIVSAGRWTANVNLKSAGKDIASSAIGCFCVTESQQATLGPCNVPDVDNDAGMFGSIKQI